MRQSIAAILVAGALAQGGQPGQPGPNPLGSFFPQPQGQQGQFQGQFPQQMPQVQPQQMPQQVQQVQQVQLPQQAQQAQVQFTQQSALGQLPQQAVGPVVKGIPIGTSQGITDSDIACRAGVRAACNLPDVPNLWNPDANKRYQTQQSDQLVWQITQTGNYAANGQRVANQNNPNTVDIPYYQTGSALGQNFGAVYSVNPNDPFRRPVDQILNYVTRDPRAPEGFRPSASNAVLPSSSAYLQANFFPQTTTPVNTVTGAGFGYSKDLNAPGVSPVFTGGNWGNPNFGAGFNMGGVNLGRPTQQFNFGTSFVGNPNAALGLTGFTGTGFTGAGWNGVTGAGWNGMGAGMNNLGFQTVWPSSNFQGNFAPPTQNFLPTLPNGLTTAPAWTPTTGTGREEFRANVAPQQGQMPAPGFNGGFPGGFNGGFPGGFNGGFPGGFNGGFFPRP